MNSVGTEGELPPPPLRPSPWRPFFCPGSRNAEFCHCFRGMLSMIRSLYLAGPDVFRPDARERGRELKALCAQFGSEGLFPLDQEVPVHLVDPGEQAAWCYRANIALIERADAVLAHLDRKSLGWGKRGSVRVVFGGS